MNEIFINPPPTDKKCECCGKSDLKPFGKAGDPLVGDFNGSILVKSFRPMAPELSEERIKKLTEEEFNSYDQAVSTISASWECRNCIILSNEDYFKIMYERYSKKEKK